jgi:hypothetical protein
MVRHGDAGLEEAGERVTNLVAVTYTNWVERPEVRAGNGLTLTLSHAPPKVPEGKVDAIGALAAAKVSRDDHRPTLPIEVSQNELCGGGGSENRISTS